ncbi:hypothetical protein RAMLITH_14340 [Ramlibacter sp. RBP-2]|uniref:Uncharacterized protein n=1 Tax=Ramlibacter lithotrophicus TaxID=2606681 RepID=A0A7X6DGZ6_9BURK|nr:hypothetical protein [Ramlibacter lithotrophicus]NKE67007.1 hypothetical protein [Ramlibacter lithotrophicus]
MVTSQPHRSGAAQAWWAHTGSTNRGFVSLDPERQREVDSDRPAPRKSLANAFTFDVRRAGAAVRPAGRGKSAARKAKTAGEPGCEPPADEGGSRR